MMKKMLCMALVLCCLAGCAMAQDMTVDLGGIATMSVPADWQTTAGSDGLGSFALPSGAKVTVYDYSGMGATPEAVVKSLQSDPLCLNIKAGLLDTGSSCVTFDFSSVSESGIVVMDEDQGVAICLRYSPISDSELGLIVKAVAGTIAF